MSERTSYAPGTPCWVDLATPDIEAARGLLRRAARLGGPRAAELGRTGRLPPRQERRRRRRRGDAADAGGPADGLDHLRLGRRRRRDRWPRSSEAGGQVMVEPMDVMDLGTMAVFTDPTGAVCGVWQAGTFAGAASWSTSPAPSPGTSSAPATSPPPRSSTAPSSAGASTTTTWGRWAPTPILEARRGDRSAA